MPRLIYIHKSLQRKQVGGYTWDPERVCKNELLTVDFATDGYVDFLEGLLERKIIDEAMVVIETNPYAGRFDIGNLECYCMPNLDVLHDYLRPDDVILMRGGYRWWIPFVNRMNKEQRWLIFYSAGTGKSSRAQWDVVIMDGIGPTSARGKLYMSWNKPINSTLFQLKKVERIYDVCIGASKIYDTKQQWRFIDAAVAYKKIYGEDLECVMAGNFGTLSAGFRPYQLKETTRTLEIIKSGKVSVDMPGHISRDKLATIFNQSKIFGHQCSGQNDRAALEATVCGVPLLALSSAGNCYAPWITRNPEVCYITQSKGSAEILAKEIREWVQKSTEDRRKLVADYASTHNDIEFTYKQFEKLFVAIKKIGKPDRARMINEFIT